uniref:Deoxyribonuclease II n=1 Tax=Plectus sambesii TaxID=2011161 RepID=A0A914WPQ7_9BILA
MMQLLVVGLTALFAATYTAALSCKDQAGKDVDWFVVYKLPQQSTSDVQLIKEGTAFLYMDAKTKKDGWKLTTVGMDKKDQAVAYTLQQVYDNLESADHFHMMYNDEHGSSHGEGKSDGYRAHSKGTAVFNQKDGVWLIHSIPAFPPPEAYGFAEKSKKYGQSMMCITFNTTKSLEELSQQWYRHHLSVYASKLPLEFIPKYPLLGEIVASNPPSAGVSFSRIANLQSKGGLKLTHFAKNRKFDQDLYSKFVAPELKSNLYVETWLRGLGDLKSGCPIPNLGQTVYNIREVNPAQIRFGSGNDHSKWAVAETAAVGYVCIGDINRQASQFSRGGGTMCFKDADIYPVYRNSVTQRELCAEPEVEDGKQKNGPFEFVPPGLY